jgi:hypothetical protein
MINPTPGRRPDWVSGQLFPFESRFLAPIREALSGIPLQRIMDAIDVSRTAASKIRSGKLVPHVRHWETLGSLTQ